MALNSLSIEKKHSFIYTKHVVFETIELETSIKNALLSSKISSQALHYGKLYDKELSVGEEALSSIKWVHEDVGYGLYSTIDLQEGSFIGEYTGLICENNSYYKMKNYLFRYPLEEFNGKKLSIDAEPHGNLTRFINHSFEPNLLPVHAFHNGLYHVILIAIKPIKKGEAFSYNYGHSYWYLRGAPTLI